MTSQDINIHSFMAKLKSQMAERFISASSDLLLHLTRLSNSITDGQDIEVIRRNAATTCRYAQDVEDEAQRLFRDDGGKKAAASELMLSLMKLSSDLHGSLAPASALSRISTAIDQVWALSRT